MTSSLSSHCHANRGVNDEKAQFVLVNQNCQGSSVDKMLVGRYVESFKV